MRIAYFGGYDPEYTRVRVVVKGLRRNGVEVFECQSRNPFIPLKLIELTKAYLKICRYVDIIMVCEAGQSYVPLAKLLAFITRKPLALDAFLSYYHVYCSENSGRISKLKSTYFFWLDKAACVLADIVFLDTDEHAEYFAKTFKVPIKKFRSFPVGSDTDIFYREKREKKSDAPIDIFCVASFYPLHGVEYIVDAVDILNKIGIDLRCTIVGDGQLFKAVKSKAETMHVNNINFLGRLPIERVAKMIRESDICLGQFGGTAQADMVVPIKVYDALASGKPIVTQVSRSVSRMFSDGEGIVFCRPTDGDSIAEKVAILSKSQSLRENIGNSGFKAFVEKAAPIVVGRILRGHLENLINKK